MISLFFSGCMLWIALSTARNAHWKPLGWAKAWFVLFLYSGLCRIILWIDPDHAPLFAQILLILFFMASIFLVKISTPKKLSIHHVIWIMLSVFVFLRNMHPQYDVDSLSYHLPSLVWFRDFSHLTPIQKIIENQSFTYRLIGFEEFLAIAGIDSNLPYFAGLVGGVLKLLSLYSIVSVIPSQWKWERYLAAFFLLIDDHFFFSGQSRFVYLTPSLIGLVALSYYLAWRGLKGSLQSVLYALVLACCLPACKFHGLYFAFGIFIIFFYSVVTQKYSFNNLKKIARKEQLIRWFACPLITVFSMYGLNWIETGSPTYPIPFGSFVPRHFSHSISLVAASVPPGSFIEAFKRPIQTLVFSGNLALKFAAVLLVPFLTVCVLTPFHFFKKILKIFSKMLDATISRNNLEFAAFGFFTSFVWACIAEGIVHGESRYPRYVFGLTILSIIAAINSVRFRHQILKRNLVELCSRSFGVIGALLLMLTIDNRYFNIPVNARIHWKNIALAFQDPDYRKLEFSSPDVRLLLDNYWVKNIERINSCLNGLEKEHFHEGLLNGDGILLYAPGLGWPSYYAVPNAIRGDLYGELRLPNRLNTLHEAGISYVLFPKTWRTNIPNEIKISPLSYATLQKAVTAHSQCDSGDMDLVLL